MKREAIVRTLALLEATPSSQFNMLRYGTIRNGESISEGCIAHYVVVANLKELFGDELPSLYCFEIGECADKALGIDSPMLHSELFMSDTLFSRLAPFVDRLKAVRVLWRLLDTGYVDWRPEFPEWPEHELSNLNRIKVQFEGEPAVA